MECRSSGAMQSANIGSWCDDYGTWRCMREQRDRRQLGHLLGAVSEEVHSQDDPLLPIERIETPPGTRLVIRLISASRTRHNLGRFRLALTGSIDPRSDRSTTIHLSLDASRSRIRRVGRTRVGRESVREALRDDRRLELSDACSLIRRMAGQTPLPALLELRRRTADAAQGRRLAADGDRNSRPRPAAALFAARGGFRRAPRRRCVRHRAGRLPAGLRRRRPAMDDSPAT